MDSTASREDFSKHKPMRGTPEKDNVKNIISHDHNELVFQPRIESSCTMFEFLTLISAVTIG